MNKFLLNLSLATFTLSSLIYSDIAFSEQPKAEDLVGKVYGGIHALHIEMDNERLMNDDPKSSLDSGDGLGAEVGYRWLPSTEFRLSYSQFKFKAKHEGYPEPDGSSIAVDMLFFPTEKNFYLLTGVNNLDVQHSQISANLGAGYRHYLNDRMGLYFETKAHYQFSEHYDEISAQVGFVYFFGDNDKTISPQTQTQAVVMLDADNDGVVDDKDQCADTPMLDKVDQFGCTVFIEDEVSIKLLVQFDNNQSIIKPEFTQEITAMANFLRKNPETTIIIEGHASSPGSEKHNKELSQRRADAIVDMLVSDHNISAARLSAIGYGEEQLLNHLNDESAHRQNRRIIANVKVSKKTPVKR
jgi:OOP family OmpA-OmpF porin